MFPGQRSQRAGMGRDFVERDHGLPAHATENARRLDALLAALGSTRPV